MHLSTIVIGDMVKPRPAHGSLGLALEIHDDFATSGQRALPASVWTSQWISNGRRACGHLTSRLADCRPSGTNRPKRKSHSNRAPFSNLW